MAKQKTKGYGRRPEGKHAMGDGLILIVGKKGSAWYGSVKVNGKKTTKKIAVANQQCSENRARAMLYQMRADAEAKHSAGVPTYHHEDLTLGAIYTAWAAAKLGSESWSERHHAKTTEQALSYLGPLWDRSLLDLTRLEIIRQLEQGGSRDTAGRIFSRLDEAFSDAENTHGLIENPLSKKPQSLKVGKGNRFPSYGSNIAAVQALYQAIQFGTSVTKPVQLCSQALLLTGLRNTECRSIRREYVDFQKRQIVMPREIMKEKEPFRGDFVIPMSPQLEVVLKEAIAFANYTGSGYVFPHLMDPTRRVTTDAIREHYNKLTDRQHVPHGNRTSLFTWAIETYEAPRHVANTLLDHKPIEGTEEHYSTATFVKQRKPILLAWSDLIAGNSANVVSINRRVS